MITYILYHSSKYDIVHSKKYHSYEDDKIIFDITTSHQFYSSFYYLDIDIQATDYNTFIHDAQQYIEQTTIHISSFRRFIKNTFPRIH